ncbi:pleckstrin homology domain-containing family A member 8-like [Dendronephthya gigantea]|uniref:pleckstrin homology domain-containing family A member 8-like n=1 Tax=Dendronephthya gigantea TaxID=151771 RepID=UPI00106D5863|nr:pleckstrin homology domain-containing family A member 8-like [Dendronephthya gigantea]
MPRMEGALWKWTNYVSGWQLRWFVLDFGVLSYYKSQDDIKLGCRGSVKMGCCDVTAQVGDALRINLKFPPDQYMYIKATTASERQQWLVALGSSKACLTQGNVPEKTNKNNQVEVQAPPEQTLHEKMSEMHVCQNILLDQINAIKNLCEDKEKSHEFHEAATLLSATCDAFLTNLADCVKIAEHKFGSGTPLSSPISPLASAHKTFSRPGIKLSNQLQSRKADSRSSPSSSSPSSTGSNQNSPSSFPDEETIGKDEAKPGLSVKAGQNEVTKDVALNLSEAFSDAKEITIAPTIFSTAPNRFKGVEVSENGEIPTKSFLLACNSILPIFDVLGPTAFAPVKLDISGNIKKLTSKYDGDRESCSTLQSMINVEIHSNTCTVKNSATDALLWLKRALQFTNAFLMEINKGERELVVVASNAYSKTLRKYHGWMVRGVFALAVKAVPYWKDFVTALGSTDSGVAPEPDVLHDIKDFTDTLSPLIERIDEFYAMNNLDNDNTV